MNKKMKFLAFNAAVIYKNSDYQINREFADQIVQELKDNNINAKLILINSESDNIELSTYDIIINRTRETKFLKNLKENVKIYNHPSFTVMANDKFETYKWATLNKINVLPTEIFNIKNVKKYKFPLVAKKRSGFGGKDVHKIDSLEQLFQLNHLNENYIVQKFSKHGSEDIRVYVMFKKIIFVLKRSANPDEFRSNFKINGNAKKYHLTWKQKSRVKKMIKFLPTGFYGIDFFLKRKKLILNEIEDVVGSRALYAIDAKINIPKLLVKNIIKNINKNEDESNYDLIANYLKNN